MPNLSNPGSGFCSQGYGLSPCADCHVARVIADVDDVEIFLTKRIQQPHQLQVCLRSRRQRNLQWARRVHMVEEGLLGIEIRMQLPQRNLRRATGEPDDIGLKTAALR